MNERSRSTDSLSRASRSLSAVLAADQYIAIADSLEQLRRLHG